MVISDDCIVSLEHIWTQCGDHVVHQDINLCLKGGEILGIVGGSGSGKTMLLREMLGLQAPTSGTVCLFGQTIQELSAGAGQRLRERCGVLFQNGALFSGFNVFDNIALPLREMRVLDEELIRQLVCMKLSMVGLDAEVARLVPEELSGGMVRRVGLARALALEPELLLLDEPTSGLDPIASEGFVELVRSLHHDLGFTVAMITHDLSTLHDLCDRVAVLADGQIVALGPLHEVAKCSHPFVQQFFHGRQGQRILTVDRLGIA